MSNETKLTKADLAEAEANLFTVRDYIRYCYSQFNANRLFYGHGTDNGWDEALYLVLRTLHLPWDAQPEVLDGALLPAEKVAVLKRLELRVNSNIPLPYILKEAVYMGLSFNVDERVLIPRSPIAELIEAGFSPWLANDDVNRILDLCSGSGCIGIAMSFEFPEAEIVLADLSVDAIDVAESNIVKHDLNDRVTCVQSDLYDSIEGTFDLIVSNPPYVDSKDYQAMPKEFSHEPKLGLVSGEDGLDIVKNILSQSRRYLNDNGLLVVEVGNSWVALERTYPDVLFNWIEFEHGGGGVFVMSAEELDLYQDLFQ